MPFTWVLYCPNCDASFTPEEEDWDGPITCPGCDISDVIDHDAIDPRPIHPLDQVFMKADDPAWPKMLSDEELDLAAGAIDPASDGGYFERLMMEFARRGRKPPDQEQV